MDARYTHVLRYRIENLFNGVQTLNTEQLLFVHSYCKSRIFEHFLFSLYFQLINKYLSSAHFMPSTLPGPEDIVVNQTQFLPQWIYS